MSSNVMNNRITLTSNMEKLNSSKIICKKLSFINQVAVGNKRGTLSLSYVGPSLLFTFKSVIIGIRGGAKGGREGAIASLLTPLEMSSRL